MINTFTYPPRFPLRIRVAGEYCEVTGGSSWKGKALSGHKQNLAGKFCVVAGEFSDLRCLINTLTLNNLNNCLKQKTISCHASWEKEGEIDFIFSSKDNNS